jgi:UDP-2,3-diacylglucosamine hydrolase
MDRPDIGTASPRPAALFASDVHLQPSMPRTAHAFLDFLLRRAPQSPRLFLLGDLFEAWPGDDDIDNPFHRTIADALRSLSDQGVQIGWIAGNRDFLVGAGFAAATGVQLLTDPSVVVLAGRRIVLSHGDAQCTDDADYQRFRAQVRDPAWQRDFLARPLAERKAIAQQMREGSKAAQRSKTYEIMDVNGAAIDALFDASGAEVMVHGHTHRPACHDAGKARIRYVLPDWDCDGAHRRGGWLELLEDGSFRQANLPVSC